MSFYCLLVYTFSEEVLAIIFTVVPHTWVVSWCFQDLLFIFVFQKFDYDVSKCRSFCIYPTLDLLSFLGLYLHIFHQTWEVFDSFFWLVDPSLFLLGFSLHNWLVSLRSLLCPNSSVIIQWSEKSCVLAPQAHKALILFWWMVWRMHSKLQSFFKASLDFSFYWVYLDFSYICKEFLNHPSTLYMYFMFHIT